ncbi:MAG: DUF2807 domain-containing protein [Flavobacteriales bacterium]|nr:DUF2807 domain-containing protein [Flavobacteriales bacterium]
MKHSILFLTLLIALTGCMNCLEGTGDTVDEDRVVAAFDVIDNRCSADIKIRQLGEGEQAKVFVRCQENLLPHLLTRVESGRLVIDVEGCISTDREMEVYITTPTLSKVVSDGSGSIESQGAIRSKELKVVQDGSGNIMLSFNGDVLEIDNDGSGAIRVLGMARELEISNDGSGSINAYELPANEVEVSNDGSGNVAIHAVDVLSIELSGSGSVQYQGDPQEVETSNSGSGSIEKD